MNIMVLWYFLKTSSYWWVKVALFVTQKKTGVFYFEQLLNVYVFLLIYNNYWLFLEILVRLQVTMNKMFSDQKYLLEQVVDLQTTVFNVSDIQRLVPLNIFVQRMSSSPS